MRHHRCLGAVLLFLTPLLAEASSLDRSVVTRVVEERRADYQKCYEDALGWNPNLKGRLVIRFTVEADGQVSAAAEQKTATQKFPDDVMPLCIVEHFLELRFPPSPEAFHIVYPMVFAKKSEK